MPQDKSQVTVFPRNQFMLEELPIGRGGYGTVFRGQHTKLGIVAIKTLIDTGLLPQKHLLALQREAEKLRGVCQHPSILNLHGIITEKNNYSLVLEYMPLGSATEFRKDFNVQWPLIVQIIRDLADGMTFLHEHKPTILHLDLKGDNILLDKLCRAKISDFGLSEWKTITMTVTRGGRGQDSARTCTVTHVPPEVWSNVNLPSDKYYDIYSFGIVIWELLSGQFPYKTASEELIRSSVLSGQRPDFIQIPKDCPMFLTKMMTRCWHQKPTQRPHFKDLKPELNDEFEKNYRKLVVKSLKSVRREITQTYPPTDPAYVFTNEIDNMVEPVEPVEPVPSTSQERTTTPKVVEETQTQNEQKEPPKEEPRAFQKFLFKKNEDLSIEDKDVRKVLFSPTACRLLKTRHFKDIFKVTEETRQVLINPVTRKEYIESDETLGRQVRYSKCNALTELDGEYYDYRKTVGIQWAISSRREYYDRQSKSYYIERPYGSYDQVPTERGKKHRRAVDSLEKNPGMKKLRNGGSYYKVKMILENPEVLKQAISDREKGVSNALRLVAIDNESLDLLKNPFLLMMVFGSEYDIKRKYCDDEQYKDLFTELFANATYKSVFPSGGYKLPEDMCDMIPHWLEAEMIKEGFDVNKMTQMQDTERRRRQYLHGMFEDSDDDDFDDFLPMRHLSRRMMDINVKPTPNLHKKFEGYNFRRMVNEVEKTANKTDLAKKIIRILTRPPREEREKEKEKNKEKRSKGMPSNPGLPPDLLMRGGHPLEMMKMMGMDPSRMDDKTLMRTIMKLEHRRMKEMRAAQIGPDNSNIRISPMLHRQSLLKRKAPPSPSSSSSSATVSKPDLETDASGSMPTESEAPGEQGQTNPSDPKKSKSDEAKSSKEDTNQSQSTAKDGSVEIEHKHSGMLGGITKLLFGKNTKLPNMQVGDRNVMRIGGHYDDSDDDMTESSYDKSYKPPSNERAPTKGELDKICSRIHGDYRNLGRQLKMPYNTVEQIVEDYRKEGMHEMTYQIIKKWQEMNGSEASNVALSNALHKMRRDDLSKFLRF